MGIQTQDLPTDTTDTVTSVVLDEGSSVNWRRSKRVRVHLIDRPGIDLPRVDGLLVSRRHREFLIGVPSLTFTAEGNAVTPEGRFVSIPRESVAFFELL